MTNDAVDQAAKVTATETANGTPATFQICQIDNSDCLAPLVAVNGIGEVGTDEGAAGNWIPGNEITGETLTLSIPSQAEMDETPLLVATSKVVCSLYWIQNQDSSYSILMTHWEDGEEVHTADLLWTGDASDQDFMLTIVSNGFVSSLTED